MGCAVPREDHHQFGVTEGVCVCVSFWGAQTLCPCWARGDTGTGTEQWGSARFPPRSQGGPQGSPLPHCVNKWGQEGESPIL